MNMQRPMGRVNRRKWAAGCPTAISHELARTIKKPADKVVYCLESASQLALFYRTGWSNGLPQINQADELHVWGWAGGLAIRDWQLMTYRVLTLNYEILNTIRTGNFGYGIINHLLELELSHVNETVEDEYILREGGISTVDFHADASTQLRHGGATGVDTSSGA